MTTKEWTEQVKEYRKQLTNQLKTTRTNMTTTEKPITKTVSKKYILIRWHDYTLSNTIIMNNDIAMDYIIKHSDAIECLEYVDIVIPA